MIAKRIALALLLALPLSAAAETPVRTIEDSLEVPEGMDSDTALAAVEDLTRVFANYEPVVPWVPGVKLDLEKQVLQNGTPTVLALPVEGEAFGRPIVERAQVTAVSRPFACEEDEGLRIDLLFAGSSHNVERRIDRIEITACPRTDEDGQVTIDATGEMYAGHLPRDPDLNAFEENIGAKALQTAFIKQVPAVFDAVEETWADRPEARTR